MKNRHLILLMGLSVTLAAGDPCEGGREAAKERGYQTLIAGFQRPKAYWTSSQVEQVPGLLRAELARATDSGDSCTVLGVLDLIDDLDRLNPGEQLLQAEVLWAGGQHKAGEKASRDTVLGPLLKAMLREEKGKTATPGSRELLRADRYRIVQEHVSWPPMRALLIRQEGERILATEDYLLRGELQYGFREEWLRGLSAPSGPWEAAWGRAWEARDLIQVHGLIRRSGHYCPGGISTAIRTGVAADLAQRWELPYRWAELGLELPAGHPFPASFAAKVEVARAKCSLKIEDLARAEPSLAAAAENPRDRYELAGLRLKLGSEDALKRLLADRAGLKEDPQVPGWSLAQIQDELRGAEVKVAKLAAEREAEARRREEARLAELKRQEEARRLALEKERQRRERVRRWSEFSEVQRSLGYYVEQGNDQLRAIYRAAFSGEPIQPQIELLRSRVTPALAYPGTANTLRNRMHADWANGAGRSIAGDGSIPTADKGRVFAAVKQALAILHAPAGAADPEEAEE